jgi:outer membrane protein OmpA-like peptidoglycan-associated protein
VLFLLAVGIASGQTAPNRPLRLESGLVVVSAINDAVLKKDYEVIETTQTVDASGVVSGSDWAIPDKGMPDGVRRQSAQFALRAEDLEHARRLILWWIPGDPDTMPGTTRATPSTDVFNDARMKGDAAIVVGALSRSDSQGFGAMGLFAGRKYFRGNVKKVGSEPVRVMVDGVPTALNTIHVKGDVTVAGDHGDVEFWWVDDPVTRFALRSSFQGSVSQVVRIDRPKQVDAVQALAGKACRSEVPGIYFLSDSAQLLPASKPAIERIVTLLHAHPEWTVTIEGHTDNTGSDQHNLDLSKRRAETLKRELSGPYGIPSARLSSTGYGSSRPVETNQTLEGRAHNRRVEISRRC